MRPPAGWVTRRGRFLVAPIWCPDTREVAGIVNCMEVPARPAAQEAAAVTETALALAGHELDPFTREVIAKMGRGELTGDQAVEAIIARFAGASQPV